MKKVKTWILFFLLLLFLPVMVWAKEKINLKVDKTDLELGDEVTIVATLPQKEKLYAFTAMLQYDHNVFEDIDDTNFLLSNESIQIVYNSNNNKFGMINPSGEIPSELFHVTLKVKENANAGKTSIGLTNISSSDGGNKATYETSSIDVLVIRDAKENEVVPNAKPNEIKEKEEELLKTVATKPFVIGILVVIILFIGIMIYLLKNHREKRKLFLTFVLATIVLFLGLTSILVLHNTKRDVNQDGVKDYEDAKDIIKYLIDFEGTRSEEKETEENIENVEISETEKTKPPKTHFDYDVNHDGQVDIEDAGSSTEDTTNHTTYHVTLSNHDSEHIYISKNANVTLEFEAVVTLNEPIIEAEIDGVYYPVTHKDSFYSVIMPSLNVSGVHHYQITKVKLGNHREVKTSLTISKEVLKDIPSVAMFYVDDEENTIHFEMSDPDKALKEGTILVTDRDQNVLIHEKIGTNNQIHYDFEKDVYYTVQILGTYDLDTNQLNEFTQDQNLYENQILYTHDFLLGSDYKFALQNVNITDAILKGETPEITFLSTNQLGFDVEYIVVGGKKYNAYLKNEQYVVALDDVDTSQFGKYYVDIDKIVLNNLKDFEKDRDYEVNTLNYTVLKYAPQVDNIVIQNHDQEQTLEVSYDFRDEDKTLLSLDAVLMDSTFHVVEKKEDITPGETLTFSYQGNEDGRYIVKFLADCDLGTERHIYTDYLLGEKEVLTQNDITITKATVSTIYPIKNQEKYQITYEVALSENFKNNHIYNVLSGVTINGLNYDADKTNTPFASKISFTVPSESGVLDLEATRIQLQYEDYNNNVHQFFSVMPYHLYLDVLKEKPTIKNLKIVHEDYQKQEVTFQFEVVDDNGGFETGEVELFDQRLKITKGINEITFSHVLKDEITSLKFYGTYDLDTNTLENEDKTLHYYENDLFYEISYGLFTQEDYDTIEVVDFTANNVDDTSYYEKYEEVMLSFGLEGLNEEYPLQLSKVVINEKEYPVEKEENHYIVHFDAYHNYGKKEIILQKLIFTNGKSIALKEESSTSIIVLKDPISVDNFQYNIKEKEIAMHFTIKDLDHSVNQINKDLKVFIFDEDNQLLEEIPYQEDISIKIRDNISRYYVKVYANYDRDIVFKGEYQNQLILDEVISLDKNYLVLKDIIDITLYKEENGRTFAVEEVKISDIEKNINAYSLKISMNSLPTVYSKIRKVYQENNQLFFVLDYDYVIQEGKETQNAVIPFGTIQDGKVKNEICPETFEELIKKIKANPNGEYYLTHDLDASTLDITTNTIFDTEFSGILHGNGYTIKNLPKPLFTSIIGGTVENLKLDNVVLPASNAEGSLASTADAAIIKNVWITGFTKKNSKASSGTLFGIAKNHTIISESRVTNMDFSVEWNAQQIGGLVGILENSQIENCYVEGSLNANYNFIGGLVGNALNGEITNSYSNVTLSGNGGTSCSIACSYRSKVTIKQSISVSSGFRNSISNYVSLLENNFELSSKESNIAGVTSIIKEDVNETLFKDTLQFDETIWNMGSVSMEKLPTFIKEKDNSYNVSEVKDFYEEEKELLYHNLAKLMPFYNPSKIVKSGMEISANHILNKEELQHVVPIDENGNVVTYLTTENPKKIKKLKLVFKNKETLTLEVRYENTFDMVASYRISSLKIDYTFSHYVINSNSELVNHLTNYLAKLNYTEQLDSLTPTADSRIYREFYESITKKELKEFVYKYLSTSNYTNTTNDEMINDYIEKEIKKNQKLEKALYVYNYFRRFYHIEVDGIYLDDFLLFHSEGFSPSLTPDEIAKVYLSSDANFNVNATSTAYDNTLSKYTNLKTIPQLLEYFVTTFGHETPSVWFKNAFKGYIVEISVDNRPDIEYTLWDHITNKDVRSGATWYNYALPILTLEENAAYIISSPTQFLIGSQRVYMKDPFNNEEQKKFREQANIYIERMKDYYDTASKILKDATYFNEIHTIQIDKRFTYDSNGNYVFQSPYTTQEPFHKNFNELLGLWAHQDGNAATSNGTYIFWRAEAVLDGEWTYHTWSHETAHNIDARLFLKNNGRRYDAGGEDYADSNLMQAFGDGDIVMNLSRHFEKDAKISSNLDPERIDNPTKIHDFYQKLFQTVYILDYLEGKAFLTLNSEEQSNLAVQASYPNEDKYPSEEEKYLRYKFTVYQEISQEEFEKMNLQSMKDLYENRLVMYPGVIYSTLTDNRYGGENIYKVHWYQPHNIYGRPDSYSIKWFAYEMLGYKGYDDGYIEYFSNIHANEDGTKDDLMALRRITNDESMTFEKYKLQRFDEVENHLREIQYIQVDQVYQSFVEALKQDASYVKQVKEDALKQYPNDIDARNRMISNAKQFKNSTEVRREVFYKMKNESNDFRKLVYDKTNLQDVNLK